MWVEFHGLRRLYPVSICVTCPGAQASPFLRCGAATASVDEDVVATMACLLYGLMVYGGTPPIFFAQNIRKEGLRFVLPIARVKKKSPAGWPGFSFS